MGSTITVSDSAQKADTTSSTATGAAPATRIASIDGYRGLVMFLMLAEVLRLGLLKQRFPESKIAEWIHFHTEHVEWVGCSLHDMIQPSFSFLVGAAMAFSLAKRLKSGQTVAMMAWHAFSRALILICLGIFLRSLGKSQTNFTFEDTLTQIGLGYFFLFLIALGPRWFHWLSIAVILIGYWLAFAWYTLPDASFDYAAVGVPSDWPHLKSGFESHWNKNSNLAWAFDVWFMNLFPREAPFEFNGGGYSTLSFVPTLATMLFGLVAGLWMKDAKSARSRVLFLGGVGVSCLAVGWTLNYFGICPNVKRIWTPTFALWSGGVCMLMLLAFYLVCDLAKFQKWLFPLVVIGSNSIVAYVMSWVLEAPVHEALLRHFGEVPFRILDGVASDGQQVSFEPMLLGVATLTIFWLILYWLYRQRIFVRI